MYSHVPIRNLIYVFIINEIENICRGSSANTSITIIYAFAGHLLFVVGLKRFAITIFASVEKLQTVYAMFHWIIRSAAVTALNYFP